MNPFRRKISPVAGYYLVACGDAFFFTMVVSVSVLFQTKEAGLSPIQLLLVGAALQVAILFSEVPTGIVADTFSRRLSVLIGLVVLGGGSMISAAVAEFWPIVLGTVILGVGRTFISGALEAWIADEIGPERANPVYLRAAQARMFFWVGAIAASFALASLDLNLPIVAGGACLVVLAFLVAPLMPEAGFVRPERIDAKGFGSMVSTFTEGRQVVSARPLLLTMFAITAFYGAAGQGFERLWVAHFYDDVGFPARWNIDPVLWFGIIRVIGAVLGLIAVEIVRRNYADRMSDHDAVSRALFRITTFQSFGILALAIATNFEIAAAAYTATFALSLAYDPLYLAWINQNVNATIRATVISMSSQAGALGRTVGGPAIGTVGSLASLRAALTAAGLALIPALLFYFRAFGQGATEEEAESVATPPVS